MKSVELSDMWILLLATIRYSLGRRTYMSSFSGELVVKYQDYLNTQQLKQIVEEIEKKLHLAENSGIMLGDKYAHSNWKKTVSNIQEIIYKRFVAQEFE